MPRCFLAHRREVITRRTIFELRKARRTRVTSSKAWRLALSQPIKTRCPLRR